MHSRTVFLYSTSQKLGFPPTLYFFFFLLSQSLLFNTSLLLVLSFFSFCNQITSLIQYLRTTHCSSKCCVHGRKDRISAIKSFKRDDMGTHLYPSLKKQARICELKATLGYTMIPGQLGQQSDTPSQKIMTLIQKFTVATHVTPPMKDTYMHIHSSQIFLMFSSL